MEFIRYNSIENHYQSKIIAMFLEKHPELADITYLVTEKIHGANICVTIDATQYKVGKRSKFLDPGKKDNLNSVIPLVEDKFYNQIKQIQYDYPNNTITLHGEFFGRGVQKGVDYGKDKQIAFFDLRIDGILQPQIDFLSFTTLYGLPTVPIILAPNGLEAALGMDTEFNSRVASSPLPPASGGLYNVCEGVVIKPLHKVYTSTLGSVFYIKKKNAKFLEKSKQPKPKTLEDLGEVGRLQKIFQTYINSNRVASIMSQYGEIQDIKQVSNYIKLVLEDAKEDFLKDNDVSHVPTKDHRAIYNIGKTLFNLIKEYL